MLPLLITGASASQRLDHAASLHQPSLPAAVIGGNDSVIKIEDIRQFQKACALKPQSGIAYFLILEAQNLTLPSQHALLKTLEESPSKHQIILTADSQTSLIPTLLSRCRLILLKPDLDLTPEQDSRAKGILRQVAAANHGQLIALAAGLSADTDILNILKLVLRRSLYLHPGLRRAQALRLITSAQSDLKANLNPQFVLEHLFFNLKDLFKS